MPTDVGALKVGGRRWSPRPRRCRVAESEADRFRLGTERAARGGTSPVCAPQRLQERAEQQPQGRTGQTAPMTWLPSCGEDRRGDTMHVQTQTERRTRGEAGRWRDRAAGKWRRRGRDGHRHSAAQSHNERTRVCEVGKLGSKLCKVGVSRNYELFTTQYPTVCKGAQRDPRMCYNPRSRPPTRFVRYSPPQIDIPQGRLSKDKKC